MKYKYLLITAILVLVFSGCSNLRSVGNNETQILKPAKCSEAGTVNREGKCYKRIIISAKDDGHVIITEKPDGTRIYDVDNSGHPSFASDLAKAVQAVALQKAMDGGD